METLIEINRVGHIAIGFIGLVSWWLPIVSKKGGRNHRLFGKVFAACAYWIGFSTLISLVLRLSMAPWSTEGVGGVLSQAGFLIFLGYIGLVTVTITHWAVRVIRTRSDPPAIDTPGMRLLILGMSAGSVLVIVFALAFWSNLSIILLLLSPIGLMAGRDMRRYIAMEPRPRMAWWYEHMGAMLGAGIAFHTAFMVFGSRVVFDLSILGPFNWVPWVLPTLIGTIAGHYWERFYRRRFGDLPDAQVAAS